MSDRARRRPPTLERPGGPAPWRHVLAAATVLVLAVVGLTGVPAASAHDLHRSTSSTTTSTVVADGGVPQITAKDNAAGSDDGTNPLWWVLGGVVVVAAVATGIVFVARGRNQGPID